MTLIEGIGDEVTHFFIALFVVIIVTLAWWTTNISEQRHVRTVLLLERRRHRTHRRLTNHTETVTISEGSTVPAPIAEESPVAERASSELPITEHIPREASTSREEVTISQNPENLDGGEEQNIIETMDTDACVLRQRRLAFYDNWANSNREDNDESQTSQTTDVPQTQDRLETVADSSEHTVMEHNYAERDTITTTVTNCETEPSSSENMLPSSDKSAITIKLKYINDDLKTVDGRLEELLGDFKKRHFQTELLSNKLVRLIFNGRVLRPDTQTLKSCGLFDNCVVHCLIHQKRTQSPNEGAATESARDGYSFPNSSGINNLNNNNQNRDWDLGNFLFAFISFILLAAWYFSWFCISAIIKREKRIVAEINVNFKYGVQKNKKRQYSYLWIKYAEKQFYLHLEIKYVYAHLYTVTATVGLILITGIFTIVLVGMYFPDNPDLPAPPIRFARERVQPQQ